MFNLFKRCNHEWKILLERETDSPIQHSIKAMGGIDKIKNLPWQLCESKRFLIEIITCNKCGKIKKFETEIE